MPDSRKRIDRHARYNRSTVSPSNWLRLDDFRGRCYVQIFDRVKAEHPDHTFTDTLFHPAVRRAESSHRYRWQRYTVRKDGRLRFQPTARARKIRS